MPGWVGRASPRCATPQVNLATVRRVMLVNYDKEAKTFALRHYLIQTNEAVLSYPSVPHCGIPR